MTTTLTPAARMPLLIGEILARLIAEGHTDALRGLGKDSIAEVTNRRQCRAAAPSLEAKE